MDQFPFMDLNMNNDSFLGVGDMPQSGLLACANEADLENYISGDNLTFLHQKLSEATSLNASYAQRETQLKHCIDQLKGEKQDISQKCEMLLNDQKNFRSQQMLLEQKVDAETRMRFTFQDKLNAAEKNVDEEKAQRNAHEETINNLQVNLTNTENFSKDLYKIAEVVTKQVESLKQETALLEKMVTVYKTSFLKVKKENEKLYPEIELLKEQLKEMGNTFKDASTEIQTFKQENLKQENYINDTLNRFKEITVHFGSMKEQFVLQQEAIGEYHNDTTEKSKVISEMKQQLDHRVQEIDEIRKLSCTRETELQKNVEKLQDTLDGLLNLREELEERNRARGRVIDELREENVKLKTEIESTKATLCVEKDYTAGKLNALTTERDDLKKSCTDIASKLKSTEERERELSLTKDQFEKQLGEMFKEIEALRDMVTDSENQNKWLMAEKQNLEEQLVVNGKQMEGCIDDANNTEASLKRRQSELSIVANELSAMKERKENVEKENVELSQRIETCMKSLDEEQKKIKEFEERLIKCQFIFMENDKKYADLAEKCDQLEQNKSCDDCQINNLRDELQQLKLEYNEQKTEKESLQHELKEALNDSDMQVKTTSENIKKFTSGVKKEIEGYRIDCDQKDEEISKLCLQVNEYKTLYEEDHVGLMKTNEKLSALESKNECLAEDVARLTEEKQGYLTIVENFTQKEVDTKRELEKKLLEIKDLELSLLEMKREYEQYQITVSNYDRLWQGERDQAIKELQDELSRNHRMFMDPSHLIKARRQSLNS